MNLRQTRGLLLFLLFAALFPAFAQSARVLTLDETLRTLGEIGNAELRWDPFFGSGTLFAGEYEAAFVSGREGESGTVLLDRRNVITLPLPFLRNGNIMFPEVFVSEVRYNFNLFAERDRSRFRIAAIVIDPGHGGRDPGAVAQHVISGQRIELVEKDIVLDVSKQLYAMLTTSFPDKQVLLTRDTDVFVTLEDRVDLANSVPMAENEAAIYISVHANASFNRDARGFEVWYLSPGFRRNLVDPSQFSDVQEIIPILNHMLEEQIATESIFLANSILARMSEKVGDLSPNRGLKAAEWFVVRNARMPSVLVELGFITNETEAQLLNDEAYLKKLVQALYKGISDFVDFFQRTGGFISFQ